MRRLGPTAAVHSQPGSKLGVAPPGGQVRGRRAVLGGNVPDPCAQHHPHEARCCGVHSQAVRKWTAPAPVQQPRPALSGHPGTAAIGQLARPRYPLGLHPLQ